MSSYGGLYSCGRISAHIIVAHNISRADFILGHYNVPNNEDSRRMRLDSFLDTLLWPRLKSMVSIIWT